MKATELMIGDLIIALGVVRRVTSISGLERPEDEGLLTTMVPGCEFPESNLSFRPCYARPIPLTVEILEKNGIKCLVLEPSGKRTYSCNEPPISCTSSPDRGWYLSAGPVGSTKLPFAEISKAYYVHELQHVIRDAKVEKEIIL